MLVLKQVNEPGSKGILNYKIQFARGLYFISERTTFATVAELIDFYQVNAICYPTLFYNVNLRIIRNIFANYKLRKKLLLDIELLEKRRITNAAQRPCP